jgi:hypothetical protein
MSDTIENRFLKTVKSILVGSNLVSTWSLSVVGGSLVVILSTSYIRPESTCLKSFYLIFVIGWILMAISLYHGINISGRSMACDLNYDNNDSLKKIFEKTNSDYAKQLRYFKLALLTFGIWLILYLTWWIFIYISLNK